MTSRDAALLSEDEEIDCGVCLERHVAPEKKKKRLRVPSPPPEDPAAAAAASNRKAKAKAAAHQGHPDVYGKARPSVEIVEQSAIRIAELQSLILWILADGQNPKWAFVKHKPLLERVMFLMLPGIDRALYEASTALLPNMHALLGEPITVFAKSAQCYPAQTVSALFTVPHDKKRKREEEQKRAAEEAKFQNPDAPLPFPLEHYVLTRKDMEAHGFPLAFSDDDGEIACPAGFVSTAAPGELYGGGEVPETRQVRDMVALDCEMCISDGDMVLTRVTLLDAAGQVLLDELVQPDRPITDYNTRFSGITAEMMAGVTRRLPDAQRSVLRFLGPETLLVGHALENDLAVLRLLHARCIDTAALFPHPRGPPYKLALRVLTERYLKRRIQQGAHDSGEDARAALDLARLKFRHGPAYGIEPLAVGDRLMEVLAAANRRATLIDRIEVLNRHTTGTASAVRASSDADAARQAARALQQSGMNFVWTQFSQLADLYERRARCRSDPAAAGSSPPLFPEEAAVAAAKAAHPLGSVPAPPAASTLNSAAQNAVQSSALADATAAGGTAATPPAASAAANSSPNRGSRAAGGGSSGLKGSGPLSHLRQRAEALHSGSAAASRPAASPAAAANGGTAMQQQQQQQQHSRQGAEGRLADAEAAGPGSLGTEPPESVLRRLDGLVGQLHAALSPNTLLIVHTGQGDTAECRRMHKEKCRRQAGLDGLPPWDMALDNRFNALSSRVSRALCFCTVKQ